MNKTKNTLIVIDRYLGLIGDKTILHSAEPRLELFYPSFFAVIDLPYQGVMDSYNLIFCGELSKSLMGPQGPKLRYQILFYL